MTVKVQQSLNSSLPFRTVLIYNRDRSIYAQLPMTPEFQKIMGNNPKIYCQAHLEDDPNNEGGKLIVLDRRVEDMNW